MNDAERERFDGLLEQVLDAIPPKIRELLEESPLIVEDHPSSELCDELGLDPENQNLCGLHSGTMLTERSVTDDIELPETIHIFREGIIDEAGGWEPWESDDGEMWGGEDLIREEIRITVLHEIGHHFGLDEDGLTELGYD